MGGQLSPHSNSSSFLSSSTSHYSCMTRHSKNNTANSVFSYAEHKKLSAYYGSQSTRLGSSSLRPFDACALCLCPAETPVVCSKGHLYCKPCVIKDLIEQRAELERKSRQIAALREEEDAAKGEVRRRARERVLQQFERGQGVTTLIGKRKEREDDTLAKGTPV